MAGSLNVDWVPEANGLASQNMVALSEAATLSVPSPSGSSAGTGRQQAAQIQNYVALIEAGNTAI